MKLAQLRKIKNFTPYHVRKQLAESLILSKLDYCNSMFYDAASYHIKRLQKVQNCAASFVTGTYCKTIDVMEKLNWLPVKGRVDLSILKLVHKRLREDTLPNYITLRERSSTRTLRANDEITMHVPKETNTFEGNASRIFNNLPKNIKEEENKKAFHRICKQYLFDRELCFYLAQ